MISPQSIYRTLVSVVFMASFGLMVGQIERNDSIDLQSAVAGRIQYDSLSHNADMIHQMDTTMIPIGGIYPLDFDVSLAGIYRYRTAVTLPRIDAVSLEAGSPGLFSWRNGSIILSEESVSYPGLMQVDTGAIGVYQGIGNFDFYLGAVANKYGWYRGLKTQYGLTGSFSYRLTPKLAFKIYGTYYLGSPPRMANGLPMPPSMLGYYGYTKFGGYMNYDINDRFGVQMGGQIVKRTYHNAYELEPIATPYIKIGSGKKKIGIGLPVGQILYGIFGK